MTENRSSGQKRKSSVFGLYSDGAERGAGLVCVSNLGFAWADKRRHIHSMYKPPGRSSLRAQGNAWFNLHKWQGAKHMPSCWNSPGTETWAYGILPWTRQARLFVVLGFSSLLSQKVIFNTRIFCAFGIKQAGNQRNKGLKITQSVLQHGGMLCWEVEKMQNKQLRPASTSYINHSASEPKDVQRKSI